MVNSCKGYTCEEQYGDVKVTGTEELKLRFHRFPEWETDKALCNKWMVATQLLNLKKETLKSTYI